MQAVVLAAGESSRFWPLSEGRHKCMNNFMGKTILEHTLDSVRKAGVDDIIVVQGPDMSIEKEISDSSVKFVIQKEPRGMGDAVSQARKHLKKKFFVLGPHHVNAFDFLKPMAKTFKSSGAGMALLGRETKTPWIYGVLDVKNGLARSIVEKPPKGKEPSNIKAVSMYMLSPEFFDYLEKVPEHHYNYEEALGLYMRKNDVPVVMTDKDTISLKYPWHMLDITKKMLKEMKPHVSDSAKIDSSAKINGKVHIGEGVRIFGNATVNGPCYIGKNSIIGNNSLVRDYCNLEEGAMVGMGAEVTRTIFQKNVHIHSGFFGDSVLGENCRVGAGSITANVRIDRSPVKSIVKGKRVDTGRKSMGAVIGENTRTGIGTKFMPGVMIGNNCTIGPNTIVKRNLESGTLFYTEFKEVVKRK